jgi:hypothetical protein
MGQSTLLVNEMTINPMKFAKRKQMFGKKLKLAVQPAKPHGLVGGSYYGHHYGGGCGADSCAFMEETVARHMLLTGNACLILGVPMMDSLWLYPKELASMQQSSSEKNLGTTCTIVREILARGLLEQL